MDASGQTLRLRTIGPFTVSEQLYPNGLIIPRHTHSLDYITFVLEGTFRERYGAHSIFCRTGAVRFLPAGVAHENEISAGLRCLHIAAEPATLDQLRQDPTIPRRPSEISGLTATWLANRLYMEFSRQDTASEMAIQGVVLELLAEIARSEAADPALVAPHWLQQAVEIVESRFLERLSLSEIAAEVGVHYVHLSRQFHKYNRCTVGELIRRRRVQYASHLLAHSNTPLAEIALTCGFSDQSHLSFLFKRYMGMSPSKFRSLAGTNSVGVTNLDFSARVRAEPLRAASGE